VSAHASGEAPLSAHLAADAVVTVLARAGYAARGVVFVIVGFFATLAAFGADEAKNVRGALFEILAQPFGRNLLLLLAVSLFGLSVWRLVQGLLDADGHGTTPRGLFVRSGLLLSAATYGSIGFVALRLATDQSESVDGTRSIVRTVLSSEFGQWVVTAAGIIILVVGGAHVWKGIQAGFLKWMDAPRGWMTYMRPVFQFGLVVRGITICLTSVLLFLAGTIVDPEAAPGLRDILRRVQDVTIGGNVLLAVLGIGLTSFGLYSLAEAMFREVEVVED